MTKNNEKYIKISVCDKAKVVLCPDTENELVDITTCLGCIHCIGFADEVKIFSFLDLSAKFVSCDRMKFHFKFDLRDTGF